ncbi:MAG: hypothetical protein GX279_04735 [Clostridiaceae bacterium]|nr:hypothetical protein [Clostridiaceae bacterium]
MKRVFSLIIAMLLIFTMTACSQPDTVKPGSAAVNEGSSAADDNMSTDKGQDPGAVMRVKVMNMDSSSFLAASMEEGANAADIYRINAEKIKLFDKNSVSADIDELKTGMIVDIHYDGAVMESFPMQLGGIGSIHIREEGDDIAGLYMQVIKDLYKVDPGLNSDIQRLAFDLNGAPNLTETEKTALVYLAGNEFGLETLRGTFEELREQGYIDKDLLAFETGLLYTIEVKSQEEDSFVFDARKWRGGDGAYYFLNCTAKKGKDGWTYTIGGEAIS